MLHGFVHYLVTPPPIYPHAMSCHKNTAKDGHLHTHPSFLLQFSSLPPDPHPSFSSVPWHHPAGFFCRQINSLYNLGVWANWIKQQFCC